MREPSHLVGLAGSESEFELLEKLERTLRGRVTSFRADDRLSRADVHERGCCGTAS